MEVKYNVTGARRKQLVQTIARITEADAEYKGAPTFAYEVDLFTITRDGTLEFSDRADAKTVEKVLDGVYEAGFLPEGTEAQETEEPAQVARPKKAKEPTGLTVSVPADKVDVPNLTKLLEAKGNLIRDALGIEELPVEAGEDEVSFPWFSETPEADEAAAYTHLIASLCRMSVDQKRITATAHPVANQKYAFRCLLLRLGFIGDEYKADRKILLRNLSGSSAFRDGDRR